jgi:hypothetical protein
VDIRACGRDEAHDGERVEESLIKGGRFEAVSLDLRLRGRSALAEMFGAANDAFATDEPLRG